ncbi:DUF3244 domain-containing protein [Parabacteroides sp. GYB001]|uniref:DUF3244 domain-containing protein n=1 Tax=Parabacteroides leei TaxID=2939491 RepID=UPI002016ADBF|nr:DUF3244 domain-containing protein [Parabacteroides leei]MCL3852131.1 DUF3244 domain-containing protein [Parabacteroides leei]
MRNVKVLLIMMLALFVTMPAFALRQIRFKNYWIRKAKSFSAQFPIVAYIEDDDKTLHLQFLENLGDVTVCVKDESGNVVYDQLIETVNDPSLVIPMFSQKGNYIISVSNEYNNVEGEFDF